LVDLDYLIFYIWYFPSY